MTALPSTASRGPRAIFSPDEAEHYYLPLASRKGPHSTRELKEEAYAYWHSAGEEGARWLVRRLRDEHILETLHEVASVLGRLGEMIVAPAFEELSRGADADQALCLLWALGSLSESNPSLRVDVGRWAPILSDLLRDKDSDVREQTAEALRLLGPERAIPLLEDRLPEEQNEYARATIEQELKRYREERS